MGKHFYILVLFALASIALIIFLIKKNHRDRKNLFKKLPGDYPDPKMVESEFDSEN
jgi:hypothetical protein